MNGRAFIGEDGKLKYRSISGDVYRARQVGETGPAGRMTIEVLVPGVKDPMTLSRVLMENPSGESSDEKKT